MSRGTDVDYRLHEHLGIAATKGYHMRLKTTCSKEHITDLNRDFNFRYAKKHPPTCGQVLIDLYRMWKYLGLDQYSLDTDWCWIMYFDLVD